jgi:hypothetical protein
MNLGDSGPTFERGGDVVNARVYREGAWHDCSRAKELNELRDIDGGMVQCLSP